MQTLKFVRTFYWQHYPEIELEMTIELIALQRQLRLLTSKSTAKFCWKSNFLVSCIIFFYLKKKIGTIEICGVTIENWWHRQLYRCRQWRKKLTNSCHRNAINEIETIELKQIESHTEYTSRWRIGHFATHTCIQWNRVELKFERLVSLFFSNEPTRIWIMTKWF